MSINVGTNEGTSTTTLNELTDVSVSSPSDLQVLTYDGSSFVNGWAGIQMIQVRNDEGSTIAAGTPLYSKGGIGGSNRILVGIADANDPTKMPCIGIAFEQMNTTTTKDNYGVVSGIYNTSISGFSGLSVGDVLYVSNTGTLTDTKPSATDDLIQNVGIVLKTNGTDCQGLLVSCIGRTNDVPNPPINLKISSTSTDPILELENSNSATDKPALFRLNRSSSTVADDMELGQIDFYGKDSNGDSLAYAKIVGISSDTTHPGDEQGQMSFYAMSDAGGATSTMVEMLRLGAEDSGASPTISTVQVNVGNNDVDFIVRGTSINSLIRTDAGNNAVGINQSAPIDASAIFEIESTTKGFLPPRMTTTQQNAISSPALGLVIYNTTTNKLMVYNGAWTALH